MSQVEYGLAEVCIRQTADLPAFMNQQKNRNFP